MRHRAIWLVAAAIACTDPLAAQAREISITVRLKAYEYPVRLDTVAIWNDVIATPAESYLALKQTLDSLRIPTSLADSTRGLLHHQGFTAIRKLAGRPMSWAWRCGSGMTGDYADTYRMTIAYAIVVDPVPDGNSRIGIAFVSGAQNLEGVSTNPVACASTGALEQYLLRAAQLNTIKRRRLP
jgi:hypothetical protein